MAPYAAQTLMNVKMIELCVATAGHASTPRAVLRAHVRKEGLVDTVRYAFWISL